MRTKELDIELKKLMNLFPKSFVNANIELILVPRTNLYFLLSNVESPLDFKCKIIAWCSRACCKTAPYSSTWRNLQYQESIRDKINCYLGTKFDESQWMYIYTCLGNDVRRGLCEKFVQSNFDIEVIKQECAK